MVIEAWRPYRPSRPLCLFGGGDRASSARSPRNPGLAAREARHRTIGKPIELTPGSTKVETGAAARNGPVSPGTGAGHWRTVRRQVEFRDRRDVEATVPAVTKPNLRLDQNQAKITIGGVEDRPGLAAKISAPSPTRALSST